jgi:repressor LexA
MYLAEIRGSGMQLVDPADPGDRGLTPRRRKIVQVIEESVRRNAYGSSMREIAEATGLASTSSVSHQLRVLEEQGLVSRTKRRPRTTRLQPRNDPDDQRQPARGANQGDGFKVIPVPLVGRIPAGGPKLADESIDDVIMLPAQLVGHGELIMLSVDGDSMAGAAITNGDWVVVRRQPDAENGDIVAAMLESDTSADGEATVKTFLRRDGHVWLMLQNPKYLPIAGDNATIIGKVVAVLRRV